MTVAKISMILWAIFGILLGTYGVAEEGAILLEESSREVRADEGDHLTLACEIDIDTEDDLSFQWLKEGNNIGKNASVTKTGKKTTSLIDLKVVRRDHGSEVICRIYKGERSISIANKSAKLFISYAPDVKIKYGSGYESGESESDSSFMFKCQAQANPDPSSFQWHRNGKLISDEHKDSLHLSNIIPAWSGNYTCTAINTVGRNTSTPLTMIVKFDPVCNKKQQIKYITEVGELSISCDVEGYPNAIYRWDMNGTSIKKTSKTIIYNVEKFSLHVLKCQEFVKQKTACEIHLVPQSLPEPVSDCKRYVNTNNDEMVKLTCQPPSKGKLDLHFTLEIYTIDGSKVFTEDNSSVPEFNLPRLSCQSYNATVYAVNSQGRQPYSFIYNHTDGCSYESDSYHHHFPTILGTLTVVILIIIFAVCVIKRLVHHATHPRHTAHHTRMVDHKDTATAPSHELEELKELS